MKIIDTPIPDLKIIEPKVYGDDRGFFFESWKKNVLHEAGITNEFVQENHSKSSKGVLRGLHFQTDHTQAKLVRVIVGSVYDVAVDIRKGSPSYGDRFGVELSAINKKQLFVPQGFAHGFLSLEDNTEFLYLVDDVYDKDSEAGLMRNDPIIGIEWEKYFTQADIQEVLLSDKDKTHPSFNDLPDYFTYQG